MTRAEVDAILQSEAVKFRTNVERASSSKSRPVAVSEDMQMMPSDWFYSGLVDLLVLSLVWGTLLSGLILIVRERVDKDDLSQYR